MQKCFIIFSFLVVLTSCINLRDQYPEINYYNLSQEQGSLQNISLGKIEALLQIKDFAVNEQYDTEQFLAVWPGNKVQKYFYHRWITTVSDLITDFLIVRYNSYNLFSGGVTKKTTLALPQYVMEGSILEMLAHNSESDLPESNFVSFSIKITLIKNDKLTDNKKVILSKVFTGKAVRMNYSVESIAPAFSKAISQVADKILIEVQESIAKESLISQ